MEVIHPDEILMPDELPTSGQGSSSNLALSEAQAVRAEIAAFHKRKASAIFMIGISGGITGARLAGVKVHPLVSIASMALGFWGYHAYTKG